MYAIFWQDIWKILIASLVLGAGLPVVYAVGVRALAIGSHDSAPSADGVATLETTHNPVGRILAGLCFLIVVAGVALALAYIVAVGHGDQLSFSHGYPTFVPDE